MYLLFTKIIMNMENRGNEENKDKGHGLTLGICLGLIIGVAIGTATDNLALWISLGFLFGVCAGIIYDTAHGKSKKN
jgi:uncharacterized membrane protein HdeD (DUF308 family)